MWYIPTLFIVLLTSQTTLSFLSPDSLQSIAANAILDDARLTENLSSCPDVITRSVGYALLKKNINSAWKHTAESASLYDWNTECSQDDKIRGMSFLGTSSNAVFVTCKGILSWWETFPYTQCTRSVVTGYTGVTGFSVSPDGHFTALVAGKKISIWNNSTYTKLWEIDSFLDGFMKAEAREQDENAPYHEQGYSVFCTNNQIIVGGTRGTILIWNIESLFKKSIQPEVQVVHARLADTMWARALNKVQKVYRMHNGEKFVSLLNKQVKLWDSVSGSLCKEYLLDHRALFADACFRECDWDSEKKSYKDLEVVSCFHDGTLMLLRVIDGRIVKLKLDTTDVLASCSVSQDGKFLVTGTRTDRAHLWERKEVQGTIVFNKIATFTGRSINSQLAFRSDSSGLLIGNNYGEIQLWTIPNQISYQDAQEILKKR